MLSSGIATRSPYHRPTSGPALRGGFAGGTGAASRTLP
jgi:hypothetical protein